MEVVVIAISIETEKKIKRFLNKRTPITEIVKKFNISYNTVTSIRDRTEKLKELQDLIYNIQNYFSKEDSQCVRLALCDYYSNTKVHKKKYKSSSVKKFTIYGSHSNKEKFVNSGIKEFTDEIISKELVKIF